MSWRCGVSVNRAGGHVSDNVSQQWWWGVLNGAEVVAFHFTSIIPVFL